MAYAFGEVVVWVALGDGAAGPERTQPAAKAAKATMATPHRLELCFIGGPVNWLTILTLERNKFVPKPLHPPINEKLDRGGALPHPSPDILDREIRGEFEPDGLLLPRR